jgi:hypothetical protein
MGERDGILSNRPVFFVFRPPSSFSFPGEDSHPEVHIRFIIIFFGGLELPLDLSRSRLMPSPQAPFLSPHYMTQLARGEF